MEGADPTWDAMWSLNLFIAKNCAGLVHEYRPDIAGLREAFASGEFTKTALYRTGMGVLGDAYKVYVSQARCGSAASHIRSRPLFLDAF